ncbi:MAG: EscU/YscU/HrcU family type III secretion system export apparatus switch protein [Treponema sp.]|nr:EscU/YscU/HrcU family type III secretion system export apparatus switch protein [Treponema sp.]
MKKKKIASAIGYKRGEPAPVLLASGRGRQADQIINIAHEAGIEVIEDAALAVLLDTIAKPGDYIPSQCWEAAAKILAFVMKTEKNAGSYK